MDFGKFGRPSAAKAPIDPIEIFGKTPNLDESFNDLWAGQSTALKAWHDHRRLSDVLISLNTGAGKSIVGLLIAQSLVNEKARTLYVCSTNDLIAQTEKEAKRIGLLYTTRFGGNFSNDLYETEKAFCITNYSTVFSAFSPFRTNSAPSAIIFDDAHVAEKAVRDAVTLTISRKEHATLFEQVRALISPSFDAIGRGITLSQTLGDVSSLPIMAPPAASSDCAVQLYQSCYSFFKENRNIGGQASIVALKELLQHCCIMISYSSIEITPPFIPPNLFSILRSNDIRRVYLSATLKSKADMVRTFGKQPRKVIEPPNDAGNGERLIIFHKYLPQNLTGPVIAQHLAIDRKVLVAVPSGKSAKKYAPFTVIPSRENFSTSLNEFRSSQSGAFALVYRVDGIDLPHKTCRLMLIEGLPSGSSLLERFQLHELNMQNLYNGRLANRLTQLFGRINRGRSDYGVFILVGRDINNWLGTDRFISLMPDLIQRQIMLSKNAVEHQALHEIGDVDALIKAVLERNTSWLEYYRDWSGVEVDTQERDRAARLEEGFIEIAEAEVAYANDLLEGDVNAAREHLIRISEVAANLDAKIAGWHDLWLGHCSDILHDTELAQNFFRRAKSRLSPRLPVRRTISTFRPAEDSAATDLVEAHLQGFVESNVREFNDIIAKIRIYISILENETSTSSQSEEATRSIGSFIGFIATRPDNEFGKGPDVLWHDPIAKVIIPLELKTEKKAPATYRKKDDVGQGHDNLQWLSEQYPDTTCSTFIFVGPYGRCSKDAHPSEGMFLCSVYQLCNLARGFTSLLEDIKTRLPLERAAQIRMLRDRDEWKTSGIISNLQEFQMKSLKIENDE